MNRLFLLLAAFVVAVDLYHGAVVPFGFPTWANELLGFALGGGTLRFIEHSTPSANPAA